MWYFVYHLSKMCACYVKSFFHYHAYILSNAPHFLTAYRYALHMRFASFITFVALCLLRREYPDSSPLAVPLRTTSLSSHLLPTAYYCVYLHKRFNYDLLSNMRDVATIFAISKREGSGVNSPCLKSEEIYGISIASVIQREIQGNK